MSTPQERLEILTVVKEANAIATEQGNVDLGTGHLVAGIIETRPRVFRNEGIDPGRTKRLFAEEAKRDPYNDARSNGPVEMTPPALLAAMTPNIGEMLRVITSDPVDSTQPILEIAGLGPSETAEARRQRIIVALSNPKR